MPSGQECEELLPFCFHCLSRTQAHGLLLYKNATSGISDYGINRLAVFIPGSVFLLIVNVLFASKRMLLDLTA